MIPFERFTQKAQEAVRQTQLLAAEANHQTLQPAHLLAALAAEENGIVQAVLAKLGISATDTAARLRPALDAIPAVSGGAGGTHLDQSLQQVFAQAEKESRQFKDDYVSTEHLLLAVSVQKRDPAGKLLEELGATHEAILQALAYGSSWT